MTAPQVLELLHDHAGLDPATWRRGQLYAEMSRVSEIRLSRPGYGLQLDGYVQGSRRYRTQVSVTGAGRDAEVWSSCSCPMAFDCKHLAALVIAWEHQERTQRDWRQLLDEIIDDPGPAQPDEPAVIGVQIVVPKAKPNRYASTPPSLRPRLSIRVVRRSHTGRWVSTGMGWANLTRMSQGAPDKGPVLQPPDRDLVDQLRVALISRRGYLVYTNDPLDLSDAGPALWPVLRRLAEGGIPLLCSDPAITVRLAGAAARVQVDLSESGSGMRLRAGLRGDDGAYDAEDLSLLGEPPHGAVLWRGRPGEPGSVVTLTPLDRPLPDAARQWLREPVPLAVDRQGLTELTQEYLPRLAKTAVLSSRDGSVELPSTPQIRLRGELTWHDDGRLDLSWRWLHRQGRQVKQFPTDDVEVRGPRDRAGEEETLRRIGFPDELGDLFALDLHGPGTFSAQVSLRDAEAMTFPRVHLPWFESRPDVELIANADPPEFRTVTGTPQVSFAERGEAERRDRTDWLELEVIISVTDAKLGVIQLDLPRVLEALASGRTRLTVHKGVYVDIDRPELDRLGRVVKAARGLTDQPPRGVKLSRQSYDELAEPAEFGPTRGQVDTWTRAARALRSRAEGGEPLPAVVPPADLRAELRPYQLEGYRWLAFLQEHALGGVLADDMGLGKTVQTLAMIARAREREPAVAPFLVVVPSSVVSTWVSESARFTPGLRVTAITESAGRRGWEVAPGAEQLAVDVVVTTYTLLRIEAPQYARLAWAGLVLDEAQTVKNHRSQTHAALRTITATARFAVTGTPIENNLMELWSITSLVAPGLFPHVEAFRTEVAAPIEQHANAEVLSGLRRRLRPVLLRRTKELVAPDLPPKQENVDAIELSAKHRRIYDTHLQRERQRILKLLEDLDENRISVLASLTRLRQLALDPALVDPTYEGVGSAKTDALVARLKEVRDEGHRALVFSQFTRFLGRVRERLSEEGIETDYLDGSTTRRASVLQRFRSGTSTAFLISLKAGGVGLNLTEADYCFLLDPWWNPAVETQAIDRTHRIGQQRPVLVYRMVSAGTIEEKVMELAARKADLYRSVLDDDGQFSRSLGAEDIAALIGGSE